MTCQYPWALTQLQKGSVYHFTRKLSICVAAHLFKEFKTNNLFFNEEK